MLKWISIAAFLFVSHAQAQMMGQFNCVGAGCIPGQSKRIVLNTNFIGYSNEYATINRFLGGEDNIGPSGSGFSTGTVWNSAILDSTGFPCTNQVNLSCPNSSTPNPAQGSNVFGGGINIPASTNFAGPYCVQGYGTVTLTFNGGPASLTAASGTKCANFNSGTTNCDGTSHFTNSGTVVLSSSKILTTTDESWQGWCIALNYSGPLTQYNWAASNDDPNNTGHYVYGLEWYEQGDGADLVAGKIFRAAFKAPIVALDPCCIRTMNDLGGNGPSDMSFLNRQQPGQSLGWDPQVSGNILPYGVSSGTQAFTVAAVTGTPAAATHSQVVQFRAGSSKSWSYQLPSPQVTNISIPVSGTVDVVVNTAEDYTLGQVVVFAYANGFSSNVLNLYPATITDVVSDTEFQFALANTGLVSTCASQGACGAQVMPYASLQVGSEAAYPIDLYEGGLNYSTFYIITAGTYYTFCFNKNIPGYSDGAGNVTYGAWLPCRGGSTTDRGKPIEYLVALVNELNAMNPKYPINLWMMIPTMALTCNTFYCDPDTNSTNEWAANAVNVALNGANGFSGLNPPAQLNIQGGGNECWNSAWTQSQQLAYRGWLRWGGGTSDFDSFCEILSQWQITDIKQKISNSRVHFVDGGWITGGYTSGSYNYERITGTGLAGLNDAANPIPGVAPITMYDWGYAVAPYIQVSNTTANADIGTAASPGTLVTQWISDVQAGGYSGTAAQSDVSSWVSTIVSDAGGNSINSLETTIGNIANLTGTGTVNNSSIAYGKPVVGYEGSICGAASATCSWVIPANITALSCTGGVASGTATGQTFTTGQQIAINNVSVSNYNNIFTLASASGNNFTFDMTCPGSSPSASNWQNYYGNATDVVNGFNLQVYFSSVWASTFVAFNSTITGNSYIKMPAIYTEFGSIWGYANPDAFGATNTEGNGLAPVWTSLGAYNASQQNFLLNRDLPGHPANDYGPVGLNAAA